MSPPRLLVLFRAVIVRAVWSSKMTLANAPAILNLLGGPVGIDPAFHIVWSRFRMMRRFLAYCPRQEPRIFRMLDLFLGEPRVMVPFISFFSQLLSWFCLGWGGAWVGLGLPPSSQNDDWAYSAFLFILLFWMPGVSMSLLNLLKERAFWVVKLLIFKALYNYLPRPTCGDKILLRAILCGGVWNGFLLGRAKKEDVPCRFCGERDGDGHLFWECTFPSFSMSGNFLNSLILCL